MVLTKLMSSSIHQKACRMPMSHSKASTCAGWWCREDWAALGPVVEAFAFDFADWRTNMAPAEMRLRLQIDHGGVWNAVAFWFELGLDEETRLSTSPYADKARHRRTDSEQRRVSVFAKFECCA